MNAKFYEYWLVNGEQRAEIARLTQIVSQQQKQITSHERREEANALSTHKRRASQNSVSAHFAVDSADVDIDEREMFARLEAKEVRIHELEVDVTSWQHTHAQIYDDFNAATKLYRQELHAHQLGFEALQTELAHTKAKLRSSARRNSVETSNLKPRSMRDIDDELAYDDDSDSSADGIGGGVGRQHTRRGSKPWIAIKAKMEAQRQRQKKKNAAIRLEQPQTTMSGIASRPHSADEEADVDTETDPSELETDVAHGAASAMVRKATLTNIQLLPLDVVDLNDSDESGTPMIDEEDPRAVNMGRVQGKHTKRLSFHRIDTLIVDEDDEESIGSPLLDED